jgi:uncharacterized protein YlzI (FlbEa/FlbD family)
MNFFQINEIDSVNLNEIEVIRMYPSRVCAVLSGHEYTVEQSRVQDFLSKMSMLEKNIGLTQQYLSV